MPAFTYTLWVQSAKSENITSLRGSLASLGPAVGALVFSLLILFPVMFLDFDSHHDGLIVASAIGVKEGLFIHSEVFSQYGPVSAWTQVPFLYLPLGEALSIRLWTVVHIGLTAMVLADLWRVWPKSVAIGKGVSLLSAVVWVSAAPAIVVGEMLPWSSVQATFLVVLFLYLFLYLRSTEFAYSKSHVFLGASAGFVLGLIPFTRINVGLALSVAFLGFAILQIWVPRLFVRPLDLRYVFVGWSIAFVGLLTFLAIGGGLGAYLRQSVLAPWRWSSEAAGPESWDTLRGLSSMFAGLLWPEILLSGLIVLLPAISGKFGFRLLTRPRVLITQAVLLLGVWVYLTESDVYISFFLVDPTERTFARIFEQLALGRGQFLYFLLFAGLISWVARLSYISIWAHRRDDFWEELAILLLVGGASLALLVQLYPTYDPRHVWWGSALVPLTLIYVLSKLNRATRWGLIAVGVFFMVNGVSIALAGYIQLKQDRIPAPPETVAVGLYVKPGDYSYLRDALEISQIDGVVPGQVRFLTRNGAVAVIDGEYLSVDQNFVWWADESRGLAEVLRGDVVVVTDDYTIEEFGFTTREGFAQHYELELLECHGDLCAMRHRG
jgi:hypothetical protein